MTFLSDFANGRASSSNNTTANVAGINGLNGSLTSDATTIILTDATPDWNDNNS